MTDVFHMGWPFASVMIAAIFGCVIIYGIKKGG